MDSIFSCSSDHWGTSSPWASFTVIVLIGLVTVFMVSYTISKVNKRGFCSSFKLHPEEGLSKQGMFWIAIFLPISMFLTTGAFAWWGCEFSLSSPGYINFFIISKLPLGLLALAFPLGLMVTRIHGTEQTASQINKVNIQLDNAKRLEKIRLAEKSDSENKLYIERHVEKSLHAIEKIKLIINEEINGIFLLIKRNIEKHDSEAKVELDLNLPKQHITGLLNDHFSNLFELENINTIVVEIINVAKLLQAASSLRDDLVRNLSSNKVIGNHLLDEHLWLINAIWLEFSKSSDVVDTLACHILEFTRKETNDGVKHHNLTTDQITELHCYKSKYEDWQSDSGRTFFGFSV